MTFLQQQQLSYPPSYVRKLLLDSSFPLSAWKEEAGIWSYFTRQSGLLKGRCEYGDFHKLITSVYYTSRPASRTSTICTQSWALSTQDIFKAGCVYLTVLNLIPTKLQIQQKLPKNRLVTWAQFILPYTFIGWLSLGDGCPDALKFYVLSIIYINTEIRNATSGKPWEPWSLGHL